MIPLGEAVRLRTAPRRSDQLVPPKPCLGCGAPVDARHLDTMGRRQRYGYCADCLATRCPWCKGIRRHGFRCAMVRSQPCKVCGVELSPEDKHHHRSICPACRPNVVGVEELEAVYLEARRAARRAIRRIVGPANVEDVLQDTFLSLLVSRSTLTTLTPALFVFITRRRAGAFLRSSWRQRFMPMTPEGLLAREKDQERERRGHPEPDPEVRLPAGCPYCGSTPENGPYCGLCARAARMQRESVPK